PGTLRDRMQDESSVLALRSLETFPGLHDRCGEYLLDHRTKRPSERAPSLRRTAGGCMQLRNLENQMHPSRRSGTLVREGCSPNQKRSRPVSAYPALREHALTWNRMSA